MLVASRATAGPTPRCIECGAEAHYIELHARWVSACEHGFYGSDGKHNLVTREQLEREVRWAREALDVAEARLRKFGVPAPDAPTGGRDAL